MDLAILKHLLRLAGITNIQVRFDDQDRQIVANFTQGGSAHTEYIKYTELERLLSNNTEAPAEATGSPGAEEIIPWGPLHKKNPT